MNNNKLNINSQVYSDFETIQTDIDNIVDIIQKTYRAMLKLDDSAWVAKEKDMIDAEFMPYLKKFSEQYRGYLNARLNLAKDAAQKYEELDQERAKLSEIDNLNM